MKTANGESHVVFTGVGPVTGIGVGRDTFRDALFAGQSGAAVTSLPLDVGQIVELPLVTMPAGANTPGLGPHLEYLAEQNCPGYRDLAYALLAVELALRDAGIEVDRQDNGIGVIQAFEAPGVEHTVARLLGMIAGPLPTDGPPRVYDALAPSFYHMQSFLYVHLVGKAFGLHGFSTAVHNACSSGAFAVEAAAQQIRSGGAEVMVVVGGEAFETAVRLEWFRRVGVYAAGPAMRPFSPDPTGFYAGEGGAALVLESAEHAQRRGARVYGRYLGGAFAHQGWKQTIPDLRAARLKSVIDSALTRTARRLTEVDLVVPHGAATQLSDGYESSCLKAALGDEPTDAVAAVFKPAVGHLLGASGLIDTIAALLAMEAQAVPPAPGGDTTAEFPVPLNTTRNARRIDTILKLSTGFTGHDAASLFARE